MSEPVISAGELFDIPPEHRTRDPSHDASRDALVESIGGLIHGKTLNAQVLFSVIVECVKYVATLNATSDAKKTLIIDALNISLAALPIDPAIRDSMKVLANIMVPDLYDRYSAPVDEFVEEKITDIRKKQPCCTML